MTAFLLLLREVQASVVIPRDPSSKASPDRGIVVNWSCRGLSHTQRRVTPCRPRRSSLTAAIGVAGLIVLIFLLDLVAGIFGRNIAMDILFILGGAFLLWQGVETILELR